jgi:hypothetical protein
MILRHFSGARVTAPSKDCALHHAGSGANCGRVERAMETDMKTTVAKFAIALALAGGVALSAVALSLGGSTASLAHQCVPQYDSAGAQMAPYC